MNEALWVERDMADCRDGARWSNFEEMHRSRQCRSDSFLMGKWPTAKILASLGENWEMTQKRAPRESLSTRTGISLYTHDRRGGQRGGELLSEELCQQHVDGSHDEYDGINEIEDTTSVAEAENDDTEDCASLSISPSAPPPNVSWVSGLLLAGKFGIRLREQALQNGVIIKRVDDRNMYEREVQALGSPLVRNSAFIVFLEGVFHHHNSGESSLLLEFCPHGDLVQVWQRQGLFSVSATMRMAAQVCIALDTLHRAGFVHGDIKPENICFDISGNVKLIDFGLSQRLKIPSDDSEEDVANGIGEQCEYPEFIISGAGTLAYAAPEILCRRQHRFEADWWSFGVVLFEAFTGNVPWPDNGDGPQAQCRDICMNPIPEDDFFENMVPLEVRRFVVGLLDKNQQTRLGSRGFGADIWSHAAWQAAHGIFQWNWIDIFERSLPVFDPAIIHEERTEMEMKT